MVHLQLLLQPKQPLQATAELLTLPQLQEPSGFNLRSVNEATAAAFKEETMYSDKALVIGKALVNDEALVVDTMGHPAPVLQLLLHLKLQFELDLTSPRTTSLDALYLVVTLAPEVGVRGMRVGITIEWLMGMREWDKVREPEENRLI